jgi:hypothetical protein
MASMIRTMYKFLSVLTFMNIIFGKRGHKGKRVAKSLVRRQAHKGLAKLLR